ncbi:DinB family protein [Spirosoma radiotolerans]|uniref:DinB family protein n=1 Tax=Spirosoma radiotolerans TaxID=1379870 RepID=UPI000627279E|nr:DinB family protein [Spirosoma radiotolerans]
METEPENSQRQLDTDSQSFSGWADGLTDEQFWASPNGKWSVAEVMQHLYLSARPVVRLLTGPRAVLAQWGRADRPSRSYHELGVAYRMALATGVKAPAAMSPRVDDMQITRDALMERFHSVYRSLIEATKNWSASELDEYCLPHPALGRLTVLEILYFTSIHTQHHLQLLQKA